MSFVTVAYEVLWIYYAYQDEVRKKVQFVTQYRRIKEYEKLKSIINILIPGIVRSRIQDGKKVANDQMSNATVVWM
jgi:IS1 family transposase